MPTVELHGVEISDDDVRRAMSDFDQGRPSTEPWWSRLTGTHAIIVDGKHYPPEPILASAAGVSEDELPGVRGVRRALKDLGFEVRTFDPDWTWDELVLALDLYMRSNGSMLWKEAPEVLELREFLVAMPDHKHIRHLPGLRGGGSIHMKLGNFRYLDPDRDGGLKQYSSLDEQVWSEYADDPERLHRTAESIRQALAAGQGPEEQAPLEAPEPDEEDEGAPEGKTLLRWHKARERAPGLARKKKRRVKKETKHLRCEICTFDFFEHYGSLGEGFAECHHKKPLASMTAGEKTKLEDLAIVCANCHRMLHRRSSSDPAEVITIDELKERLRDRGLDAAPAIGRRSS